MTLYKKQFGNHGEDLVAQKLSQNNYTILARNFRRPYGEIDIIAQKDNIVLFVEVKTRLNPFFDISEIITPSKQHKIIMVAKEFIAIHNIHDKTYRFDVAFLEADNNHQIHINYIPNAFWGYE